MNFFKISVDSLAQIIQDILPGSDKIILPLFGALETLITEGPEKAGEFVKEVIGENINEVTSFITEFPNLIKENLGKALKEFLPALVGDLARKFVGGPIGIVKAFFDLLDGIAGACQDGAAFLTKFGKAVGDAAEGGGGNVADTIYQGIKAALKAVLDMFGKVVGLDKLKKPIQKARDKVVDGVKNLFKKILQKMKSFIDKLMKKKSEDEKEGTGLAKTGELESGTDFKIYIAEDGEIFMSWNPNCSLKKISKFAKDAQKETDKIIEKKGKKGVAKDIKKAIQKLEMLTAIIKGKKWDCPEERGDIAGAMSGVPQDECLTISGSNVAIPKKATFQAHHIVPVELFHEEPGLKCCCFGIDLNSAANGVWLPSCEYNGRDIAYHRGKTPPEYLQKVRDEFEKVKNKTDAENAIKSLKKYLCIEKTGLNKVGDKAKKC